MKLKDCLGNNFALTEARRDMARGNINAPAYTKWIGKAPSNPMSVKKQQQLQNMPDYPSHVSPPAQAPVKQQKQDNTQLPDHEEINVTNIMTALPALVKRNVNNKQFVQSIFNTLMMAGSRESVLAHDAEQEQNRIAQRKRYGIKGKNKGERVPRKVNVMRHVLRLPKEDQLEIKRSISENVQQPQQPVQPQAQQSPQQKVQPQQKQTAQQNQQLPHPNLLMQISRAYKGLNNNYRNVLYRNLQDIVNGGPEWRKQPSMAGISPQQRNSKIRTLSTSGQQFFKPK